MIERARRRERRERGFSVLELLIALFIAIEILIAMAIAFDVHNKIARVQLQVTDMQQALRIAQWDIARTLRMTGRGGMKAQLTPGAIFNAAAAIPAIKGRAIEVRNNVTGAGARIARGDATSPLAFDGTDILTLRGCFSTPLFQIDPGTFNADADSDGVPDTGATLVIPNISVAGLSQPYDDMVTEINSYPAGSAVLGRLLLSSYVSSDDWGVAEITAITVNAGADPPNVTLTLDLDTNSPINPLNYTTNTPAFPTEIAVSSACLLEEYRYYIRDVREAADEITPLRPRLTRARFEAGTETAYQGDSANFSLDLADQIFDLQIGLGLDTDYRVSVVDAADPGGSIESDDDHEGDDEDIFEAPLESVSEDRSQDDWLYNDPGDVEGCDPGTVGCDLTTDPYLFHAEAALDDDPVDLYFVRVNTAARTFRPDPSYEAPDLDTVGGHDWIEDHDFDDATVVASVFNSDANRKHRRRTLSTIVEMRNIQ